MLIRHLHYFITLARQEHFARAADLCNVTQPTLSSALRKLEDDFGFRLVERGHHFVGLTPEGKRVLAWAQRIVSDFESLKHDMSNKAEDLTGSLHIGVIPAAMPITGHLTELFFGVHPFAKIEIESMSSRQIQSGLDSLELHGGLTYLDNEPLQRINYIPLYKEQYVAISRTGYFTDDKPLTWKQLEQEPLCLLGPQMQNRRILDQAAERNGVKLTPRVAANSYLTILAHLLRGGWVSIIPSTLTGLYGLEGHFELREIADNAKSQAIGLVVPDRRPMAKMTHALFSAILKSDLAATLARFELPPDKNNLSGS